MLFSFFFNDTATTEIYTLSLHDALPISPPLRVQRFPHRLSRQGPPATRMASGVISTRPTSSRTGSRLASPSEGSRSEEHTSELQSPCNLVCRLLLEKKKHAALAGEGGQI